MPNVDLPETLLAQQFIEVGYNLVEQTQTFDSLVIPLQLHVKLGEIWYAGKQDADRIALLVVQILSSSQMCQIQLKANSCRMRRRQRERERETFNVSKVCVKTHVICLTVV